MTVSSFSTGWLSGIFSLFLITTYFRCLLGLYQLKEMILIVRKPKMLAELSRLHYTMPSSTMLLSNEKTR